MFGKKALCSIEGEEQCRIGNTIRDFMATGGGVMAFQRDAYEGIRADGAPAYGVVLAKEGKLYGKCKYASDVYLMGAPPTRYLHSGKIQNVLV